MYTRQGRQSTPIAWGLLTPPKRDAASLSPKYLPAIPVPTVPTITMPTLSPNFTGQDPCQHQKDLLLGNICLGTADPWGLLTPIASQCVRGQENIITTSPVTMREHYTKTSIPASELGLPSMEIDLRTIIYNDYNRLYTIYSPVCHNYRRIQSKWT